MFGSEIIFVQLQKAIWHNQDIIFMSPGYFSMKLAWISFILFFISAFQLVRSLKKDLRPNIKHMNEKQRFIKQFGMKRAIIRYCFLYTFLFFGLVVPPLTLFNHKFFFSSEVIVRSGIPLTESRFLYQNVEKIESDYTDHNNIQETRYDLVMPGGERINLTTVDSDAVYILEIEKRLPIGIPHTITKEAYKIIVKWVNATDFDHLNWKIVNRI
jgi:hypothetical protein